MSLRPFCRYSGISFTIAVLKPMFEKITRSWMYDTGMLSSP